MGSSLPLLARASAKSHHLGLPNNKPEKCAHLLTRGGRQADFPLLPLCTGSRINSLLGLTGRLQNRVLIQMPALPLLPSQDLETQMREQRRAGSWSPVTHVHAFTHPHMHTHTPTQPAPRPQRRPAPCSEGGSDHSFHKPTQNPHLWDFSVLAGRSPSSIMLRSRCPRHISVPGEVACHLRAQVLPSAITPRGSLFSGLDEFL